MSSIKFNPLSDADGVSAFPFRFAGLVESEDGTLGAAFENVADENCLPSGFEHLSTLHIPMDDLPQLPENFKGVEEAQQRAESTLSHE